MRFLSFLRDSEYGQKREIDTSFKHSLLKYGWNPKKKNVIVIHGFNGTESKSPMTIIRDGTYDTCVRAFFFFNTSPPLLFSHSIDPRCLGSCVFLFSAPKPT